MPMKKILSGLLIATSVTFASAQSSLYQNGPQQELDENLELFDKHQFAATSFGFRQIREGEVDGNQAVTSEFHHAIAALKIEQPGGSDWVRRFIRNHPQHPRKTEAAYELGSFFFEKKNYKEAIAGFQLMGDGLVTPEVQSEVAFKMGYSFFQLKNYAAALPYFTRVKGQNSPFRPDAHYYSGFIQKESGKFDLAIADFLEAEKNSFYAPKVPYMIAGLYYQQRQFDTLIPYAESALKSGKTLDRKEEIHLFLAEAYFEKRNFQGAASNYDAFVNAKKRDLDRSQVYKAGVAQFETGNFQRASDYFKVSAVQDDRIGQVSSYYLGHSYLKLNNPQFASNSFNAAYKSNADPNIKEDALVNYAKLNLERGSFQEAVNALDAYLENYPNGRYARQAEDLLTDALINTSNYLRAIDHIEKLPRKSERMRTAYQKIAFYQGVVYYRDKKHDLANTYFDKSLSTPSDRDLVVQTHFWKGENNAAADRLPQAIKSYETLQGLRPNASDPFLLKSYYGLGYAFFNTQQYPKAEAQFRQYIEKGGKSDNREHFDEALVRLGDVYFVQKKFTESQNAYQRAISEGGSSVDYAYFRSGVVYNFQNRNSEAIAQLDRLITGYPNSIYFEDALFQKSQINMEEMRYADAVDGFSKLIAARPNSQFVPHALEGRAVANFSRQQYDQTIEDYKRILDRYPNSTNAEAALVGLQESLALQGRSAEFSQYLATYRKANPGNTSVQGLEYEAAKNLYLSGSWEQSYRAFETYLRNYPQSANKPEASYFMADAQYRLGRKAQALELFYQIDRDKNSPQRSRAVQRIASIELENKNYKKAIGYLRESINYSRNPLEENETFSGLMHAYLETGKIDSTIFFAEKVVNLGNVTPDNVPEALLIKAKALQQQAKTNQAEETLRDLVNDYKSIQGAEGLFLLAESQAKRKSYEQSNNTIFDFSAPFFEYDYWYGRAFVLLAENYLALGETFQAKATLESIVENSPNPEIKALASQKLATIQ